MPVRNPASLCLLECQLFCRRQKCIHAISQVYKVAPMLLAAGSIPPPLLSQSLTLFRELVLQGAALNSASCWEEARDDIEHSSSLLDRHVDWRVLFQLPDSDVFGSWSTSMLGEKRPYGKAVSVDDDGHASSCIRNPSVRIPVQLACAACLALGSLFLLCTRLSLPSPPCSPRIAAPTGNGPKKKQAAASS